MKLSMKENLVNPHSLPGDGINQTLRSIFNKGFEILKFNTIRADLYSRVSFSSHCEESTKTNNFVSNQEQKYLM